MKISCYAFIFQNLNKTLDGAIENSFDNQSQTRTDADLFTPIQVRFAFKKFCTAKIAIQVFMLASLSVSPYTCLFVHRSVIPLTFCSYVHPPVLKTLILSFRNIFYSIKLILRKPSLNSICFLIIMTNVLNGKHLSSNRIIPLV